MSEKRTLSEYDVPLLLVLCGVLTLVLVALVAWPVLGLTVSMSAPASREPAETSGAPTAALQKTFRLTVPGGAGGATYLVVPGDGSAASGQDLYLRFRTTPAGLKEFLASLDRTTGDLTAGDPVLEQDDIDSVGLHWKLGGHLAGVYVELPERGDVTGTALVAVDGSEVSAPVVYAHVTV